MPELNQTAAARYVGLSRTSFRRAVKAGLLKPSIVHPFGGARYDTADLDAYREAVRSAAARGVTATDWSGFTPAMVDNAVRRAQERVQARHTGGSR